jgi:prepilin-type N-terminal cleavage/methylation domain-containing protein
MDSDMCVFNKNEKGFTLIELMVVVAIVGILAAIAVTNFATNRKKGYVAMINSDVHNAFSASVAFLADGHTVVAIGITDLENNGYVASTGVTTTGSAIANGDYTITSNGSLVWGLTDASAHITAMGIYDPADI